MTKESPLLAPQDNLNALLAQVAKIAAQHDIVDQWLTGIWQEQQAQTKLLRDINRVMRLIGVILILSILGAGYMVLSSPSLLGTR
jgi:hypothetical protein